MTIKIDYEIEKWRVNSFWDFVIQFHLEEQVLQDFGVANMEEVYNSALFRSDKEHIEEYLERSDKIFRIEDREDRGYWVITEVEE